MRNGERGTASTDSLNHSMLNPEAGPHAKTVRTAVLVLKMSNCQKV